MTAVDRAFIKAYTARRSMRSTPAEPVAEPRFSLPGEVASGRGAPSYRVDGPHPSAVAHAAGPHAKSTARKSRRPSAENDEQAIASQAEAAVPLAATVIEQAGRGEPVVVSLSDSAITPEWIWQRQPHPVFTDEASTAGPALATPPAKAPPAKSERPNPQPIKPQPPEPQPFKAPSSKLLSPEILSLALPSTGAAVAGVGAKTAPAGSAAASAVAAPLSSFTHSPRVEDRLLPALEVDQFLWPAEIAQLSEMATEAIDAFARQLIEGARRGQRRIGLVGAAPGAGTTTVGLCLARLARAKGATWGLLDADFEQAALATRLGIAQAAGWQAVLSGRERLADVSIASLDDHLIFVPLAADGVDVQDLAANFRAPVLFSMLADVVDLVLVDAGTVPAQQIKRLVALIRAARLDAVYLIYDEQSTTPAELAACVGRLQGAGVSIVGTIANFAAS